MKLSRFSKKITIFLLGFIFLIQPILLPLNVYAQGKSSALFNNEGLFNLENKDNPSYVSLMRQLRDINESQDNNQEDLKKQISNSLKQFKKTEKQRLKQLNIDFFKQRKYFKRLDSQVKSLNDASPGFFGKALEKIKNFFVKNKTEKSDQNDLELPDNPAQFKTSNEEVKVSSLKGSQSVDELAIKSLSSQESMDPAYLPVIEDIQPDDQEIIITSEIENLASDLDYNPVNIFNYVRNNTTYEPYYGAKKGAVGCLAEKVCNDTDSASLTIALLRASGIPARYKKGIAVVETDLLKEMMGIDEVKTVYTALFWNKVPVFTVSDNPWDGQNIDDADLEGETELGLEWTIAEAFYDYGQEGANIDNTLDLSSITTTEGLQAELADYPKKRWIPMDTVIKQYERTQNEIVPDSIDTESFWYSFFEYQGDSSPLDKYTQDLITQTGKDISTPAYQSYKTSVTHDWQILPPTLPFKLMAGESSSGQVIDIENWSILPDEKRYQLKITLEDKDTSNTIIEHTFFASEINNQPINLYYEGATQADKDIIGSYGGIHATPADLVDITPYFELNTTTVDTANTMQIGDSLVLGFELILNSENLYQDEKFSTAGNQEGIYTTFSQIADDPYLDDQSDPNINSKILLAGNAEIARQYLKKMQATEKTLARAFDIGSNLNFARAVVTQNRILTEVGGLPTTFDFKGLSLDATSYINSYSNRGNYKTNRQNFHLLWGLDLSYHEAQIFTDLAGLEAISTVTGLQHAYANPGDYTVYVIDSANESVIDTLDLSANTKANMHTDVQAGNTIITPDSFVSTGTWNGLFYVSLSPDGTGTYAIGEQVGQNGGWTINEFSSESYLDENGEEKEGKMYIATTGNRYTYEDKPDSQDHVQCSISVEKYNTITSSSGWQDSYGHPCLLGVAKFGIDNIPSSQVDHFYILASNGASFYTPGDYNYWEYRNNIKNKIKQYVNNLPQVEATYKFRFSPALGTYLQGICTDKGLWNCKNSKYETVYYTPNQNGTVYRLKEGFLDKAGKNDNKVIKILGFPTSDETAATSPEGTIGVYQDFVNGQLYYYERWWKDHIYFTAGDITELHNSHGGTNGNLGFPITDPQLGSEGDYYQGFENNQEIKLSPDGQTELVALRNYRCQIYGGSISREDQRKYTANGFLVGAKDLITDLGDVIKMVYHLSLGLGNAISNPEDTYYETKEIIDGLGDVVSSITWQQVWQKVEDGATVGMQQAKSEIENNACSARTAYLSGYIIGSGLSVGKALKGVKWSKNISGAAKIALLKTMKKVDKFGFRNDKLFKKHFNDHGSEFNAVDAQDYLNKANRFINDGDDNILSGIRKRDGDILKNILKNRI